MLALATAAVVFFTGEAPGMDIDGLRLGGRLGPQGTPDVSADPDAPLIRSLEELAPYGEPPDALYGRVRIPALGIDAPLGRRVVGDSGDMADPSGPADIVWYDFAAWDGLGGAPGAGGNAVLAGHVDRNGYIEYAGVNYFGPGVLFNLDQLDSGDRIEVVFGGKTLRYSVQWVRGLSTSSTDWNEIFSADVERDSITLVTCGGDFDARTNEYRERTVLRAVRA